jgi:hypothetical protein
VLLDSIINSTGGFSVNMAGGVIIPTTGTYILDATVGFDVSANAAANNIYVYAKRTGTNLGFSSSTQDYSNISSSRVEQRMYSITPALASDIFSLAVRFFPDGPSTARLRTAKLLVQRIY